MIDMEASRQRFSAVAPHLTNGVGRLLRRLKPLRPAVTESRRCQQQRQARLGVAYTNCLNPSSWVAFGGPAVAASRRW
jgi:hypothetical protein